MTPRVPDEKINLDESLNPDIGRLLPCDPSALWGRYAWGEQSIESGNDWLSILSTQAHAEHLPYGIRYPSGLARFGLTWYNNPQGIRFSGWSEFFSAKRNSRFLFYLSSWEWFLKAIVIVGSATLFSAWSIDVFIKTTGHTLTSYPFLLALSHQQTRRHIGILLSFTRSFILFLMVWQVRIEKKNVANYLRYREEKEAIPRTEPIRYGFLRMTPEQFENPNILKQLFEHHALKDAYIVINDCDLYYIRSQHKENGEPILEIGKKFTLSVPVKKQLALFQTPDARPIILNQASREYLERHTKKIDSSIGPKKTDDSGIWLWAWLLLAIAIIVTFYYFRATLILYLGKAAWENDILQLTDFLIRELNSFPCVIDMGIKLAPQLRTLWNQFDWQNLNLQNLRWPTLDDANLQWAMNLSKLLASIVGSVAYYATVYCATSTLHIPALVLTSATFALHFLYQLLRPFWTPIETEINRLNEIQDQFNTAEPLPLSERSEIRRKLDIILEKLANWQGNPRLSQTERTRITAAQERAEELKTRCGDAPPAPPVTPWYKQCCLSNYLTSLRESPSPRPA